MDNAKAGIPLKFIKGHTMVLDEVSDDQLTKAHPFPWMVRAPIEFMSEEHDVIDATGAVVLGDVDPDTAKALLEAASKQVVLERLTHIHIDRSPVRIEYRLEPDEFEMGSDGQTILKSMKAIKLEPGAIYELDAAGEAEIQRIARQPQVTETEDGIFISMPGPDTARTAALEAALVTAFTTLEKATAEGTSRDADEEDAIVEGLRETIDALGLTGRLPSTEARS